MASSVAGHRRAFGADVVPQCYDDLELADLVVLAGSNAAWCHPVLYQRIQTARAERGVRVVNIDPRRTATCEGADLHLPIKPGTDGYLWSGLLVWLAERKLIDVALHRGAHARLRLGAAACVRSCPQSRRCRRCNRHRPPGDRCFLRLVRQHVARRVLLQPGRQPVGAGHRQGQRHHQLPSGDRAHRQAGLRPAVAHRPAQRHGRARGRRARQHAGRAHGLLRGRARSRAPVLERAQPRQRPGPQGRRHVRCGCRRPHQGAVGDGHQSRRCRCRARMRCGRRWPSSTCWWSPRTSPATTR